MALRADGEHATKRRALAVLPATVGIALLARAAPEVALLLTSVLPFTVLGLADQLSESSSDLPNSR